MIDYLALANTVRRVADTQGLDCAAKVIEEAINAQHVATWALAMDAAAKKCQREGDDLISVSSWHDKNSAYKIACSICAGLLKHETPCPERSENAAQELLTKTYSGN